MYTFTFFSNILINSYLYKLFLCVYSIQVPSERRSNRCKDGANPKTNLTRSAQSPPPHHAHSND